MDQIETMGGAVAAIERGFQKGEIESSAYLVSQQIDSGERVVVGVNKFTVDEEEHYEPLRVDPTIGDAQCARLATLRSERDQVAVDAALASVTTAARGTDNVLYPMRDALRLRATVGEVSDALREVWGLYTPADTF
jgi:methylmalonyl-CoA mutase N-terminal domain/subunit